MRIGELLLMNGVITEAQLEQALIQQQTRPMKLGELLIENGLITERQLVEALEFQHGMSVLEFKDLVTDEESTQLVPGSLVHKHCLMPVERVGKKLKVAFYDPSNQDVLDELRRVTGLTILPYLATRSDLEHAIQAKYGAIQTVQDLHAIIGRAIDQGVPEILLDPFEEGLIVRMRQNKRFTTIKTFSPEMKKEMVRTIKRYANLEPDSKLPQEGRFELKLENRKIHVRVFTLPHTSGESLALRVKEMKQLLLHVDSLGIDETQLKIIRDKLQLPNQMVLFTSPPSQGTTSMLYSILNELSKGDRKIIAVEETRDYKLSGIYHLECNLERGFTVAEGIRSSLLQDPDVMMVDSMMKKDMLEAVAQSALAGPLVIAGGRGNSAFDSLHQLLRLGIDRYLLATSLSMIVNQRMIRKICTKCTQTVAATDEEMNRFESAGLLQAEDASSAGNKSILGNFRTFVTTHKASRLLLNRGEGCKLCDGTGYRGQVTTHEVLVVDEALKSLIIQGRSLEEIEQYIKSNGDLTHLYHGLRMVKEGLTTFEEVLQQNALK